VTIEIFKKDGEIFDTNLPRETLKLFWSELGRDSSEVRVLSCDRFAKRFVRVSFRLRAEVNITQITKKFETTVEVPIGNITHLFDIRFPQFKDLIADLNFTTTVTFINVPPEISCKELSQWLKIFGKTKGSYR
jgi:hypothetical protein